MYSLAIIGLGPRGLNALECLFITLSRKRNTTIPVIALIESQEEIGTGSAWNTQQPNANAINISDRDLVGLTKRETIDRDELHIAAFPSFIDWVRDYKNHQIDEKIDTYFNRNVMGHYLHQRAKSIVEPLIKLGIVNLINARATGLILNNQIAEISFEDNKHPDIIAQHGLLTTGHLPEKWSVQDQEFNQHATDNEGIFYIHNPYTQQAYTLYKQLHSVAIKGMGLSMIDVVHLCIEQIEGEFKMEGSGPFLKFQYDTKVNLKLYPFSLDGLPVMPKPLGKTVDQQFNVSKPDRDRLKEKLHQLIDHSQFTKIEDILKPIVDVIETVYNRFNDDVESDDISSLITNWLMDKKTNSSLWLDTNLKTADYLKEACLMAYGARPFTLDYTIGQVWRHLQPELYPIFTHSNLSPEIQSQFIKVDEFTKRYSYGPPVKRVLQLIALSDCGILDFSIANNPTIIENNNGWALKKQSTEKKAHAMVNGVLASPNLKNINDSLINGMFNTNYLEPFHDELGVKTNEHGRVLTETESTLNLSILGRNAKGSVYGVDAILECFSPKIMAWADQYVKDYLMQ
ncbi:hypothetical protein BST92_01915 [Nonlabens arenilitoris]|uniref:FAD-dependent urate hydroxylase HpyO/Asp monooxygenase CreE-like FAD/NAD(P)-binding domain-containing protein n=1 Tax=Nonlabens arenilitoris TaxID=1217969 RepID=A0A2S7U889_9FLAO|nr:FAD/NAD(P)-binding protein [Nonlabens arenilitoris]PQJ30757.1 hypothetical protein BST92_01915 [Nonlabens arenilitoris]